ncbi:hypothetical protein COBT_003045 [Conglomerata obtusa]
MINFRFFLLWINFLYVSSAPVRRVINLSNAYLPVEKNAESEISSDLARNLLNADNVLETKFTRSDFHNIYNQFELNDIVEEKDNISAKIKVLDLQGIFRQRTICKFG